MPLTRLRRLWYRHRSRWAAADWDAVYRHLPSARHLDTGERRRAGRLAVAFLADKVIEGAAGVEVDDATRLLIAANAVLPILNIGLAAYRGWHAVVVYPGAFIADGEFIDQDGIVHRQRRVLAGEAWQQGPVILSRTDIYRTQYRNDNVVIHEFAHKLDFGNGSVNGMPPLRGGMDRRQWTSAMSDGYRRLCDGPNYGAGDPQGLPFDPYACESPGEFFAVMTEAFFVDPKQLRDHLPGVYTQLAGYYQQDPAA